MPSSLHFVGLPQSPFMSSKVIPEIYPPLISYSIHPTLGKVWCQGMYIECVVLPNMYLVLKLLVGSVLFWSNLELNVVLISVTVGPT